jgi:hypothetical protein
VVLSLILTGPIVWAGRMLLADSETLTFAVGNPNGEEARFAAKLAAVLHNTNSRLRLKIVTNADNAKALAQFDRREADLVVLRTDAKAPPRARALAIPDRDLVLLLSPGAKTSPKIIRSRRRSRSGPIAIERGLHAQYLRFCRYGRGGFEGSVGTRRRDPRQAVRVGLWRGIAVAHASNVMTDKRYEQYAKTGGFTLNAIEAAKALARKIPGITSETVEAGMLSSSPEIPDDDVDTIGLEWQLLAQSKMTTTTAADLARIIYENKAELSLDDGFASKIEPAPTDKDSFIIAHPGAAEYINDGINRSWIAIAT